MKIPDCSLNNEPHYATWHISPRADATADVMSRIMPRGIFPVMHELSGVETPRNQRYAAND